MIHEQIEEHKDTQCVEGLQYDKLIYEANKLSIKRKPIIPSFIKFFKLEDRIISFLGFNVPYLLFYGLGENPDLYDFKTHTSYDKVYEIVKELLTSNCKEVDFDSIHRVKSHHIAINLKNVFLQDKRLSLIYDVFLKSPNHPLSKGMACTTMKWILTEQFFNILDNIILETYVKRTTHIFGISCLSKDNMDTIIKYHFEHIQCLYLGTSKEKDFKDFKDFKNIWTRIQDKIFNDDCSIDEIHKYRKVNRNYFRHNLSGEYGIIGNMISMSSL